MTQIILGTFIGIIILLAFVAVLTIIVTKVNEKEINGLRNIYLGKLTNGDSAIQEAMKHLELTNGIKQIGEK